MESAKRTLMYRYLMVLTIASGAGLQGWRTLFDNFAVNAAGLEGQHIGVIQSIREIPGFMTFLVVYVLFLMREHRLSALSILMLGAGVAATGFFPSYPGLILTTFVMSLGFHYYETTNQSLTLQYFDRETSPWVFGKLRSIAAATNIAVGLGIYVADAFLEYQSLFLLVGGVVAAMGLWGFSQDPTHRDVVPQRKKMVFRRRYWLFYLLTFLAGARRQIFISFAVFLMVKNFGFTVQEITILFVVNNMVNYFLSPFIGRCIIRYGERRVLSLEYGALIFIFLAYGMVQEKWLVALLYILDHIFFNFAIAIRTYFQKIGDPADIAPSMAVGFTINHIAAVFFPAIGGMLWMIDYRIPFWFGAGLSLFSFLAVQGIRTGR
jgi:hypothetical protein